MGYKVYKESPLPDLDWPALKKRLMKPVNSYKHRKDHLYFDDEDLWFWHDNERKQVAYTDIETVERAGLHGFGQMIKVTYRKGKGPVENGKHIDLHLVDVSAVEGDPTEIAETLSALIRDAHKLELQATPKRQFNHG